MPDTEAYSDRKFREIYILDQEGSLYPLYCGLHVCPPDNYSHSVRDHWLLVAVNSGRGTVTVAGETYDVTAGGAFLLYPGIPHIYAPDPDDPWVYSWIAFSGTQAQHFVDRTEFSGMIPAINNAGAPVAEKLWQAADSCLKTTDPDIRCAIAGEALYEVMRMLISSAMPSLRIRQRPVSDYTRTAMQAVAMNYNKPELNVTYIASLIGISRSYLATVFKREIGMSCIQYLRYIRLNHAKKLLEETDEPLRQIAYDVGIEDNVYFSRSFHKMTGKTPSEYRRDYRKSEGEIK